jgi:hypothetical protein
MFLKWLPWRFLASRLAKAHGFLDPGALWARIERFAQPSEVAAPMELIRAGTILHARGLINTKVIQQNLDWVWPWWVERQFDPNDESFLPRAFSLTHVNLTHRNWTAVGLPDCRAYGLVDPRGLCTPLFDGWSIDAWLLDDQGRDLLPSQLPEARQQYLCGEELAVETTCTSPAGTLTNTARMHANKGRPLLRLEIEATAEKPAWLVFALRPFNGEGVSFVNEVKLSGDRREWTIDQTPCVRFAQDLERHMTSTYHEGDVYFHFRDGEETDSAKCKTGMATAAAGFRLEPATSRTVSLDVDVAQDEKAQPVLPQGRTITWPGALASACQLVTPDERVNRLYRQAIRTLVLLSPGDCYPGPFTYRRFWFRDAVFLIHAMLRANLHDRCRRAVANFPPRQRISGFFHSQAGEWDSNGQVLWLLRQMEQLTGQPLGPDWQKPVRKGARWIDRKRVDNAEGELHQGLLPAGFSAEHLGNNDYYYWDDFWSVAGLDAAAEMTARWGDDKNARHFARCRDQLNEAIDTSLENSRDIRNSQAVPASPYRRMDAGAIGSLACSYPLEIWDARDPRVLATAQWLAEHCLVDGVFFQQMIHSGLNAYLTLHIAQVLLRAGQRDQANELLANVAAIASDTGQWPEAVHPRTAGGCMGDGQHAWASAEWVLMLHNMLLREESDALIIASGVGAEWLEPGCSLHIGPASTRFGNVELSIDADRQGLDVRWKGQWHDQPPRMILDLPDRRSELDARAGKARVGAGADEAEKTDRMAKP